MDICILRARMDTTLEYELVSFIFCYIRIRVSILFMTEALNVVRTQ